ncbi:helix-turn-helix domain-containing protein [Streptomyces hirsutus]|uniref:helix-turn-helix domain-containing protein n=1 Tax=Streptomyces hirsutus TaxID=35620 RepID=UPI00099E7E46|nr:helix-turn-helix transcriptional regulator [Streptomyces hirsutus]
MGRPDKPVDRTVPARAKLADFLRARKEAVGMTYEQMAKSTNGVPTLSTATLKRAASGTCVPSWVTVSDFIEATATEEELLIDSTLAARARGHELWVAARRATRAPYYVHKAPDPALASSESDFLRFLRHQHVWAGYPTPGEMQQSVEHPWDLPTSTTRRIIAGDIMPVSPQQATAFLKACHVVAPVDLEPWLAAAVRALSSNPSSKRDLRPWIKEHQDLIDYINGTKKGVDTSVVRLLTNELGVHQAENRSGLAA